MYHQGMSLEEVQRKATADARAKEAARKEAERKRAMEDELLEIERRRDVREKKTLIIACVSLGLSIISIVTAILSLVVGWLSG